MNDKEERRPRRVRGRLLGPLQPVNDKKRAHLLNALQQKNGEMPSLEPSLPWRAPTARVPWDMSIRWAGGGGPIWGLPSVG